MARREENQSALISIIPGADHQVGDVTVEPWSCRRVSGSRTMTRNMKQTGDVTFVALQNDYSSLVFSTDHTR